jgi:hypothetical protein
MKSALMSLDRASPVGSGTHVKSACLFIFPKCLIKGSHILNHARHGGSVCALLELVTRDNADVIASKVSSIGILQVFLDFVLSPFLPICEMKRLSYEEINKLT